MNPIIIPGFRFSGISAGIKQKQKPDLALIYSEKPALVVGSFTTNQVQAAPVAVSKAHIRSGLCSVVAVNSGNANACTGKRGVKDAQAMVTAAAKALRVPVQHVQVASTGKIGVPLPIRKIVSKIPDAVRELSPEGFDQAARAILTTDLFPKTAFVEGKIFGHTYRLAGFAKGAGMIQPRMAPHATMLAYIMTDAVLDRTVMRTLFQEVVEQTFNRVTVDGDMSTNDTALFLANGFAGNRPFGLKTAEGRQFAKNLFLVTEKLAKDMVKDGEGATKCVRVVVKGAKNEADARTVAYTIGNSSLVKTAFFGQDPNWGRILGAVGRSGIRIVPEKIDVFYDKVPVVKRGLSTGPSHEEAAKIVMKKPEFDVTIDLHRGKASFYVFASDLTLDYIKLNSCYRT